MKHTKLLLAIAAAAILCSCNSEQKPLTDYQISCKYCEVAPNTLKFQNTSTDGLHGYIWYFEKYLAPAASTDTPIHIFSGANKYDISITVQDKNKFKYSATLQVETRGTADPDTWIVSDTVFFHNVE